MAMTPNPDRVNWLGKTRLVEPIEQLWVPSDPGDTLTTSQGVTFTIGEGVADLAAAAELRYGRVAKGVVSPGLTQPFPMFPPRDGMFSGALDGAASNTLVQIEVDTVGCAIRRYVPFADHYDDVVATYTAATPEVTLVTGCGADDRPNGALVYVYEGPGAGEWNVVADYTHAGTHLVFHRAFNTDLTSASKMIILAGQANADRGVGFFGRCEYGADVSGVETLSLDAAVDTGLYMVYIDAREVAFCLSRQMLPIVKVSTIGVLA